MLFCLKPCFFLAEAEGKRREATFYTKLCMRSARSTDEESNENVMNFFEKFL